MIIVKRVSTSILFPCSGCGVGSFAEEVHRFDSLGSRGEDGYEGESLHDGEEGR